MAAPFRLPPVSHLFDPQNEQLTRDQLEQKLSAFASGVGIGGVASPVIASGTLVDVANTLVETDLLNVTIPGGSLGPNGSIRSYLHGDWLENAAGSLSVRLYCGGGVVWGFTTNQPLSAARRALSFDFRFANSNSETANSMSVRGTLSDTTAPDFGGGVGRVIAPFFVSEKDGIAVDTTADWTFRLTAQWTVASVNLSIRRRHFSVEVLKTA